MSGSDSSREPRKTLKAVPDEKFSNMLRLVFEEGGKVPDSLDGVYKSRAKAEQAIKYYNEGYDRKKIYPRAPVEKKVEKPEDKQNTELPPVEEPKRDPELPLPVNTPLEQPEPPQPAPKKKVTKKKVAKKKAVERSVTDDAEAEDKS